MTSKKQKTWFQTQCISPGTFEDILWLHVPKKPSWQTTKWMVWEGKGGEGTIWWHLLNCPWIKLPAV